MPLLAFLVRQGKNKLFHVFISVGEREELIRHEQGLPTLEFKQGDCCSENKCFHCKCEGGFQVDTEDPIWIAPEDSLVAKTLLDMQCGDAEVAADMVNNKLQEYFEQQLAKDD